MKRATNLFGKHLPDAPIQAVILSRITSLVWHVKVSVFHDRQFDKMPISRAQILFIDRYRRVCGVYEKPWVVDKGGVLEAGVQTDFQHRFCFHVLSVLIGKARTFAFGQTHAPVALYGRIHRYNVMFIS